MDGNNIARKIIIAVAPVCHVGGHLPPESQNPLTPREVADETIRCWNMGASLVHLHVRDDRGEQVSNLHHFSETLSLIRERSDMILQGSTGGVADLSLEERCVCLQEPQVEMASLNMGSVNFGDSVYINTLPDIRYWARRMRETDTAPELEVFNPSMIESAYQLVSEGALEHPLHFNFALGFPGSLQADPRHLWYLTSLIPQSSVWSVVHHGMEDFILHAAALGLGAGILRVGFEDGGYYGGKVPAPTNADLVENLAGLIRMSGREVATPDEARRILSLKEPQ